MKLFLQILSAAPALATPHLQRETSSIPASRTIFASTFHQPKPPTIQPEFKANWNQHKWNENVSHIASGYLYSSPSNGKVRADLTYDGTLGSSLFDFTNTTDQGVLNIQWLLSPAISSAPTFFTGYVQNPGFPLLQAHFLISSNAVYAGVTEDPDFGTLSLWNILFAGSIPTTVMVDAEGVIHGYDFWDPNQRTYVITRLFNIVTGKIPKDVFAFPQPNST